MTYSITNFLNHLNSTAKHFNLFHTNPHYNATMSAQEIPNGDFQDNEYQSRTGQSEIPVQADDKPVEDPIDPETADSDAQLGRPTKVLLFSPATAH